MSETADVIIAGAGIIGMGIAFQLARRSKCRIVVLEKANGLAAGSTGASSAVCRYRYTHAEMVTLARDGIAAYRHWDDFLSCATPLARYHSIGALWLAGDRNDAAQSETVRLGELGVRAVALDDQQLRKLFPALSPCILAPDMATGEPHACRDGGLHLLEMDGGYIDPVDALQDLHQAARRLGVDIRFGEQAIGLRMRNGAVAGVDLASGLRMGCESFVCAAGPWSNRLIETVGLGGRWPLEPTRIQIAHLDCPPDFPGPFPVTVDTAAGIYFRPQNLGQQIVIGSTRPEDERETVEDPDLFATFADDDFVRAKVHALSHRLPELEVRKKPSGYSGLYTINRADMHPVVGRTPVAGFYLAVGCSGHGFKIAPAIGSLIARQITGQTSSFDTVANPDFLAYDRAPIRLAQKSVLA